MGSKAGYLIIAVGSAFTFGSVYRTFTSLESMQLIFLWGVAAIVSILITSLGIEMVRSATGDTPRPNPEDGRLI